MEALKFNEYGVQELDSQELVEVEGGIAPALIVAGVICVAIFAAGVYVGYREAQASNK